MSFDFSQQCVLITGASRGIGRRTAQRFAEAGARLILHYNSHQEEASALLASLPGQGHGMLRASLEDATDIARLCDEAVKQSGRIHILVNNAGIFEECPPLDTSWDLWQRTWDRTLAINLTAAAHLCRHLAAHMAAAGGGKIVNISSRGAFRGEPTAPAYAASKAGLIALGQSLAKSLAPQHIGVYTVAPGFVETEMAAAALNGPDGDAIRNQSPMGRVATVDDVAHAVLMLATQGTEFMTGTVVDVNGASYLRM